MLLGLLGVSPSGCPEPFWVPCALLVFLYPIQNVTFLHIYMLLGLLGEPFWVPCALLGSLSLFWFLLMPCFNWCVSGLVDLCLPGLAMCSMLFGIDAVFQQVGFCVAAVFQLVCVWHCLVTNHQ